MLACSELIIATIECRDVVQNTTHSNLRPAILVAFETADTEDIEQ